MAFRRMLAATVVGVAACLALAAPSGASAPTYPPSISPGGSPAPVPTGVGVGPGVPPGGIEPAGHGWGWVLFWVLLVAVVVLGALGALLVRRRGQHAAP
ncbi:MAG: hypothetical protein HYR62_05940 [Actinobacteria bacterium]|nr:hypothetical protein [Actinomycetota bacterium]